MAGRTVLETIFLYAQTERGSLIDEDFVYVASNEWEHIWTYVKPLKRDIDVDEHKITSFIEEVGNSVLSKRWNYTKQLSIEAQSAYRKLRKLLPPEVLEPFYAEKSQHSKPNEAVHKINFHQEQQIGPGLLAPQGHRRARETDRLDSEIGKLSNEGSVHDGGDGRHINKCILGNATKLRENCTAKDIVDEVASIFRTDWRAAFEYCKLSNNKGDTIRFLLEILTCSYEKVCRPISETQLVLMQREALKIVKGDNRVDCESPDRTMLEDYRRQHACLSLNYLKQNFFQKQMQNLLTRFNIIYKNIPVDEEAVNLYTAKCVEVAWFMCIQDPPMSLEFEIIMQEGIKFVFRNYERDGEQFHYVVWPAVRLFEGGKLLEKGYAMFY